MAALAAQTVSRAGITPTFGAAASGGDTFLGGPNVYLHAKNSSGSPITVTVTPPSGGGPYGESLQQHDFTIPANSELEFGPFPAYPYADSTGAVALSYSAYASTTIAVKKYG